MRKIPPFLLLDAWRGIAALWVVMVHACLSFLHIGDNMRFLSFPIYALSVWGQLGVAMFFVISGYCIAGAAYGALASGRGAGRYSLDRIRRIYPPYLVACVAALALDFLTGLAQSHHLSNHPMLYSHALYQPQFWVANLFIMQAQFSQPTLLLVAWSLTYEIVFYALIGVLLVVARAFARHSSGATGVSVLQIGITSLTFISLAWLIASPDTCPFPLDRWYQFGLGALLFLVLTAKTVYSAWNVRGQLLLAGILTFVFAARYDLSVPPGGFINHTSGLVSDLVIGHPSTRMQAATCLVFVVFLWVLRPFDARLAHRLALRPLMWLGTISYSVYLIHTLVMGATDAIGRGLGFDHERYWVTYLAEITVAIVAGYFFYLFVERHFISRRQKLRAEAELGEQVRPEAIEQEGLRVAVPASPSPSVQPDSVGNRNFAERLDLPSERPFPKALRRW